MVVDFLSFCSLRIPFDDLIHMLCFVIIFLLTVHMITNFFAIPLYIFNQVTGFSVGGRVVDGYGAGVEGANVIVDGQLRAVTDSLGYYRLDQVLNWFYLIK